MEREIQVKAIYRSAPDIHSGILALLAYARQMQEASEQPEQPEAVSEPEASDG